jgi:PAS domain S-box-containing protein
MSRNKSNYTGKSSINLTPIKQPKCNKMNIFYLEDGILDFNLTKIELEKSLSECTIIRARTIAEAQKIINEKLIFDVAILDLKLPDGYGIDILLTIRGLKLPTAVIILTGVGDEDYAITALKAGADDYINKAPGYLKKLPSIIKSAIINFQQNIEGSAKPLKVLYIEWNKADIDLTQRHIHKYAPHIQIDTVYTAVEALKLLPLNSQDNCLYDALMLDYLLPGLDALNTIKIIKKERKLPLPVIVVTGNGSEEIAVQSLKIGADEYLVKNKNYLFRLPSLLLNSIQRQELSKQQIALYESEKKYRLLADNSDDIIFILDLNFNYIYVSPAIKGTRGFLPEEILSKNITETVTQKSKETIKQLTDKIKPLLNKENYKKIGTLLFEVEVLKKDGTTAWMEVKASVLTDENNMNGNNNIMGIQGTSRDVSKRKKAMDELRKLSHAIEQSPVSLVITDTNGNIEYVNPKFTEITGYTSEEVLGKNPRILKSGKMSADAYTDLWSKITSGKEWKGELENKKKDGETYWENASISPITDKTGEITNFIAIKEDITEKRKFQEELILAKEKAEKANQLKTEFLRNMSHEIRTPMNGIIGFSRMLDNPNISEEERNFFSKIIQNSSQQLLRIIDDILEISTLETQQGKCNNSEFFLNDFLMEIFSIFDLKSKEQGIPLYIKKPLSDNQSQIISDKSKLHKILSNLLENAIKFTMEGFIEIGYYIEDKKLVLYVKDTGIGILPENKELIFERFSQEEKEISRKYGGLGLGLSISKENAKLLGGDITVKSEKGKGSVFYVTIPYLSISGKNVDIDESAFQKTETLNESITILVAEDEEINYLYIKALLKKETNKNFTPVHAKNGKEAVDLCMENKNIDLVLMDIKMPVMSGLEATEKIKSIFPNLPVIAQTAYSTESDKELALKHGCDDFISKPIDKVNLFELLYKYLKIK